MKKRKRLAVENRFIFRVKSKLPKRCSGALLLNPRRVHYDRCGRSGSEDTPADKENGKKKQKKEWKIKNTEGG